MSARTHRQVSLLAGLVLTAGVVAFTVAYFGDTGTSQETPLSNKPAQVFTPRKQVPLDKEARRVAGRFILTAVARENLGESYDLVHPELRQGMTKREWLTGNIPVVYYPAKAIEAATFKVDESYPDEAILEVALLPKDSTKVKPQIFFIGLKKTGSRWRVNYWVPRAAPADPERPRLDGVAGRLVVAALPAARSQGRRPARASLVAAALVSIFFWNTATIVETPLHGKADVYVPPIPVKMAPAERRAVIATAALFVETAVRREHAERAYELVGPNLAGRHHARRVARRRHPGRALSRSTTRAGSSTTPTRTRSASRSPSSRSPAPTVRPAVFNLSLRSVGAGAKRRWLIDSWSPRGGGGGGSRPSRSEGSPFRVDLAPQSASTSLGAVWLLVPAALVALALLVPVALLVIERVRSRRAQKAYDASRLS